MKILLVEYAISCSSLFENLLEKTNLYPFLFLVVSLVEHVFEYGSVVQNSGRITLHLRYHCFILRLLHVMMRCCCWRIMTVFGDLQAVESVLGSRQPFSLLHQIVLL